MTGKRYNDGKPQMSYCIDSYKAMKQLAEVKAFGAEKYGRADWMKGLDKFEIIDSLLRHLVAYAGGEDLDTESGLPHPGHILANAQFLAHFYEDNVDDEQK